MRTTAHGQTSKVGGSRMEKYVWVLRFQITLKTVKREFSWKGKIMICRSMEKGTSFYFIHLPGTWWDIPTSPEANPKIKDTYRSGILTSICKWRQKGFVFLGEGSAGPSLRENPLQVHRKMILLLSVTYHLQSCAIAPLASASDTGSLCHR